MDGPEQGHTQATDPAAASKDAGDIEPAEHLPVCSAGLSESGFTAAVGMGGNPHGWLLGHIPCHNVLGGGGLAPEAGSGIWGRE